MNDYKELIVHIATVMALEDECGQKELADMLEKAADAIEQLVKERDAAVADLKDAASFPCRFCKKEHTEDCDCYTAYDKWEWRAHRR